MGGEKSFSISSTYCATGSPPHGRGKVCGRKPFLQEPWITPAWAGKSAESSGASGRERDHPRVGGEKQRRLLSGPADGGSPPRGRGKAMCRIFLRCLKRITPAWAGKRFVFDCIKFKSQDHPRTGGEKLGKISAPNIGQGSPPHGRGKGKDDRRNQQCGGITPAWAGKRTSFPKRLCRRWDHPRVGGEKLMSATALWYAVGSPPRRRGKAGKNGGCDFGDRITPAWAGKSCSWRKSMI